MLSLLLALTMTAALTGCGGADMSAQSTSSTAAAMDTGYYAESGYYDDALAAAPEGMTVAFDPFVRADGTYAISVKATTTYNDIVWVRETSPIDQNVADQSTYTWKGGNGVWTDPAMWSNDAVGASGIPGTSSSVVIEPTVASVVTLPSTKTFGKLYLSTKDAPVTIKGSLAAANIYMKSAENAYPFRIHIFTG